MVRQSTTQVVELQVDGVTVSDKCSRIGDRWVSDMDYNVYEPGVYGWTKV